MTRLRLATLDADLDRRVAALKREAPGVDAARALVDAALADGRAHYGLNTGFGALKSVRIEPDRVEALQENLLRSHAAGLGPPVSPRLTRRMLGLKIHALALGHSGVSRPVFDRLVAWWEAGVTPVVPSRGSLGASGDLAPLAHLFLPLLGEGHCWHDGAPASAGTVLEPLGLGPVRLAAKDGLALINGTQFMAAHAVEIVQRAARLATTADVVAALSLEAMRGSARPFDARAHALRPHPGAEASARVVRSLLEGSEILASHADCDKVQDPYSLRCVPQVHGASRDALAHVAGVVQTEVNSVTDNPLVFGDDAGAPDLISAGHFHGQPLALALDYAAIALTEWASISERRLYLLVDGQDGLPPFLIAEGGVQSGLMIAQYTAAALVSECKTLAHPASVDSIPSSRGQEDHVSMGAWGALKALQILEHAERVLALEALAAAQALDFRRPLKGGAGVERAWARIRERVPFRAADTPLQPDLEAALDLVRSGALAGVVPEGDPLALP